MNIIVSSYDSKGGLARLVAVPVFHLKKIMIDESGAFANVYLKSERQIVEIPIEVPEQFDWNEDMKETDGGDVYEERITGFIRCEDDENRMMIRRLEEGKWLALIEDIGGTIRVVGSEEFPLRILTNRNFKKNNGVTFSMSTVQLHPALIVKNIENL